MVEPWTKNPSILLSKENLQYFVPTDDMTYAEKINAATRFILFGSILFFFVRGETYVFFVPIVSMLIIYFLVTWGLEMDELKESFGEKKDDSCRAPTLNNPFMNPLPTDPKNTEPACNYTKDTKEKIEAAFDTNLYQDCDDIYGRSASQRQFYTMPSRNGANYQNEFATWLYGNGSTRKEETSW